MKRKLIQYLLWFLAKLVLWRYQPLVIGITGSVGKTSTKEAIYAVLKNKFRAERNVFNLNTEIGMPLTIIQGVDAKRNIFLWFYNFFHALKLFVFKDKNYPEVLILEMSEDAPGMIKYLSGLAKPKIGVVTVIGNPPVHLQYYKNTEELINEIGYLPASLPPAGAAILNTEDENTYSLKEKTSARLIFYGFNEKANLKITDYKLVKADDLENIGCSFRLEYEGSFVPIKLKEIFGKPQVYALAAAAAVGVFLEMNLIEIAKAMEEYKITKGRTTFIKGPNNSWLLDDSYNASPNSVRAALELMSDIPAKRKVAVLGEMKELGIMTDIAHREIGEEAAKIIDVFAGVGEKMKLAKEAIDKNHPQIKTFWFEDSEKAKEALKEIICEKDLVLIKGSRAMEMEKITSYLAHKDGF